MPNADFYREQLMAKSQMMEMTTRYLTQIQSELEEKNRILSHAHATIAGSIRFAELIQRSFLPEESHFTNSFSQAAYFVRQQNGIGGDQVFAFTNKQGLYFGVFDSTGHGVPAAMLSISTHLLLEEIFLKDANPETSQVMRHLNTNGGKLLCI